ncbi:MAG: hypothetical protein AB7S38_39125 [Vulcanimicrobiota bacterium]
MALRTDEGEFKVVKGAGKVALEKQPREEKVATRGVLDNPGYSFFGHRQYGDFEFFRLDEDNPVGYLPYSSSDAVSSRLPGISGGGYRYRMMGFVSLGVSGDPHVPGQSSVELVVSTPDGIDEVEVPTLDGDTVTVAPPITLRRVQTVTSTGGVVSQRVETFVNGVSLGVDSSSYLEIGLKIPSVSGDYQVSTHGQRSINYDEPVNDSYDLAWTIPVRKLQLAESLGPVEATPGQPIIISNRITWDSPGEVVDAKWTVTLSDVFDENYEFYEGTGEMSRPPLTPRVFRPEGRRRDVTC